MPTSIGLQDIAAVIARQNFVPDSVRQHLMSAPYGAIHAASFTLSRPIGTDIPPIAGYTFASLDTRALHGSPNVRVLGDIDIEPRRVFPKVNRGSKGDRAVPAVRPVQNALPAPESEPKREATPPAQDTPGKIEVAPVEIPAEPASQPGIQPTQEKIDAASLAPQVDSLPAAEDETSGGTPEFNDDDPVMMTARVYFGAVPLGGEARMIEPWAPGGAPIVEPPYIHDPDLKRFGHSDEYAALEPGETIAGKGEVTGEGRHPKSPAERLGLAGASRAKAEKCLTEAIYFESRGEAVNGQIAVAQVVLNRVFSGFYPPTVCGVVYQNAHRRLACQFTFACDGIPDRVTEPEAWTRARQIARDSLDGKLWLKQVGKSTHYHAYWVRPSWVREMMKLDKLGVHTFYRPRAWGDGADAPVWGDPTATAEAEKNL